jgi:uncharacterized membrane protein YbaN (DUF454 family)
MTDFGKNRSGLIRILLITAGTVCVALGIIGIILPVLPTTPFLLLAAACYIRSSEKFYNWLITNKYFGKYIRNYREGRGIPLRVKITAIIFLWVAICISVYIIPFLWIKILIAVIASIVTFHITSIRTLKE